MYAPDFYKDPLGSDITKKYNGFKKELESKMREWELKVEELEQYS